MSRASDSSHTSLAALPGHDPADVVARDRAPEYARDELYPLDRLRVRELSAPGARELDPSDRIAALTRDRRVEVVRLQALVRGGPLDIEHDLPVVGRLLLLEVGRVLRK